MKVVLLSPIDFCVCMSVTFTKSQMFSQTGKHQLQTEGLSEGSAKFKAAKWMLPQTQRFCLDHVIVKKQTGSPHRLETCVCNIAKQDVLSVRLLGLRLETVLPVQLGWIHTDQPFGHSPSILGKGWACCLLCYCCSNELVWSSGCIPWAAFTASLLCGHAEGHLFVWGCPFCDVLVTVVCFSHWGAPAPALGIIKTAHLQVWTDMFQTFHLPNVTSLYWKGVSKDKIWTQETILGEKWGIYTAERRKKKTESTFKN